MTSDVDLSKFFHLKSKQEMVINIKDQNDPPVFTSLSYYDEVFENLPNIQAIKKVHASDVDFEGQKVT